MAIRSQYLFFDSFWHFFLQTDRPTDQPRRVDIEAPSPELKNYQLEILTTVHQAQPMRIYEAEKFELCDCGLAMDHLHLALSVGSPVSHVKLLENFNILVKWVSRMPYV